MSFDLFTYLSTLGFFYIYSRLTLHYAPFAINYFFNSNVEYCKSIERPRILFHFTGLFFMHLVYSFNKLPFKSSWGIQLITYAVFILGAYFCTITWGKKFKETFSGNSLIKKISPQLNFKLAISDFQLIQLYNELVRFDLLNQDKTSLNDFRSVLMMDWDAHDSNIYLNMDGPTCREFFDLLIITFPNHSITLKNFFITSGLILKPGGKTYNYNTLKNALIRTPVSKKHKELTSIFSKFN